MQLDIIIGQRILYARMKGVYTYLRKPVTIQGYLTHSQSVATYHKGFKKGVPKTV